MNMRAYVIGSIIHRNQLQKNSHKREKTIICFILHCLNYFEKVFMFHYKNFSRLTLNWKFPPILHDRLSAMPSAPENCLPRIKWRFYHRKEKHNLHVLGDRYRSSAKRVIKRERENLSLCILIRKTWYII